MKRQGYTEQFDGLKPAFTLHSSGSLGLAGGSAPFFAICIYYPGRVQFTMKRSHFEPESFKYRQRS